LTYYNRDPYSLGILIEWKPDGAKQEKKTSKRIPYSLGILIEWKRKNLLVVRRLGESLLARDIN